MDSDEYQLDFPPDGAVRQWRSLTANGGQRLQKEFASLRPFEPQRATLATHPLNKGKNRYAMVYPYDEDFCRVKLNREFNEYYKTQSDYINASKVYSVPPEEIERSTAPMFYVAQGPTEKTLDDFLRMIVEQKIDLIVMFSYSYDPVTRQYAEEHARYFPNLIHETVSTEFFTVTTTCVTKRYVYIGRKLRIFSKMTNETHNCEHYHYVNFVDKGIPSDYHTMLGLLMTLRDDGNRNSRMLVHCSAGIGRSGVFVALYYLLQAFESRTMLNVFQLVNTMRIYRAHMVQTEDQYEYIYRCIAEIAVHPPDGMELDKFIQSTIQQLPKVQSPHNIIHQNFLNRETRVETTQWLSTNSAKQYPESNRDLNYVPYDHNRVILHSPSESMYINASEMSNIIRPNGTILTQEPMKNTLQPFFSMLLQQRKTFIVAVERMRQPNYTEIEFTDKRDLCVRGVRVPESRNKMGDYYHSYSMNIRRGSSQESNVFVFEYKGEWARGPTWGPVNKEHFARFVDRSIYHQRKMDPSRLGLVVHDRHGGSKAAFYCIVQNLFDRLLIDGRVAIENFASQICQQRMNSIQSVDQYVLLYEMVHIWHRLKARGALECIAEGERY